MTEPNQWGSGHWGGAQQCGHNYYSADQIVAKSDDVKDAKADYDELLEDLYDDFDVKSAKDFDRKMNKARNKLKKMLEKGTFAMVEDHLDNYGSDISYKPCSDLPRCELPSGSSSSTTTPDPAAERAKLLERIGRRGTGSGGADGADADGNIDIPGGDNKVVCQSNFTTEEITVIEEEIAGGWNPPSGFNMCDDRRDEKGSYH